MLNIGNINTLKVVEATPVGYILAEAEDTRHLDDDFEHAQEILLSSSEQGFEVGDELTAFVYYGQDRNIHASLITPAILEGQLKSLRVAGLTEAGAFFDWGLPKDLYAPSQHIHSELAVGLPAVVKLIIDSEQRKLYATTKIERFLSPAPEAWDLKTPVELLIYAKTPLGFKVVIDGSYGGLLYHSDLFKPVHIGETHQGYITRLRDDGKIDVGLQLHDKKQRQTLSEEIISDLEAHDGLSTLTDKSSPEDIQVRFNVSKATYKRALGQLYKSKKILITPGHIKLITESK
jgi:predicted RNA-binding protein (virulence factor B family)